MALYTWGLKKHEKHLPAARSGLFNLTYVKSLEVPGRWIFRQKIKWSSQKPCGTTKQETPKKRDLQFGAWNFPDSRLPRRGKLGTLQISARRNCELSRRPKFHSHSTFVCSCFFIFFDVLCFLVIWQLKKHTKIPTPCLCWARTSAKVNLSLPYVGRVSWWRPVDETGPHGVKTVRFSGFTVTKGGRSLQVVSHIFCCTPKAQFGFSRHQAVLFRFIILIGIAPSSVSVIFCMVLARFWR